MSMGVPTSGPLGLEIPVIECRAYNRTGSTLAVGDVLMFDITATVTAHTNATDNTVPGAADAGLSNMVAPTDNAAVGTTILAVALEATEDDKIGRFCVQGRVKAKSLDAIGALGAPMTVHAAANCLSDTGGANQGYFAFALEETSGAGTAQVLFNGFGWGNEAHS